MDTLKHDWVTSGLIDFEYKKYVLLAYLKDTRKHFNNSQLYPFLSDLVFHYGNLRKIKENRQVMYENFPKSISKLEFEKLKINYQRIVKDDEVMKEIEGIITYALPLINDTIKEGRELHEFVEDNLEFTPVGVTPIYANEGYLFINRDSERDVSIYSYQMTLFENAEEKYKGINTSFVGNDFVDLSRSYESIKIDLARKFAFLPNPATYLVISKLKFPLPETLLPVAKRLLVRYVSVT